MSKRLARVRGVPDEIERRCSEKDIHTCRQLLELGPFTLQYELGLFANEATSLLDAVSLALAPSPVTALELRHRRRLESNQLQTGLGVLDYRLRGGIPACTVTEIVGGPGVGKTQFSMMLAVLAVRQAAADGKDTPSAVYIDTEAGFRSERVGQMAEALFPACRDSVCSQLHYFPVGSSAELMRVLEQLEVLIIERRVRLVVLDSAAALVRKEYSRHSIVERQRLLAKQAALLKRVAEIFGIPVVVTNQMTTCRPVNSASSDQVLGPQPERVLSAALGNTWAHCVNTRLELRKDEGGNRHLCIAKSPISPPVTFPVRISEGGIVDLQQS